MSEVHIIIIKKRKLYHTKAGFRFLLHLLNTNFTTIDKFISIIKRKFYIGSGYLLIDFDNKVILSNQSAFSSSHIKPEIRSKIKKEFEYYEVF